MPLLQQLAALPPFTELLGICLSPRSGFRVGCRGVQTSLMDANASNRGEGVTTARPYMSSVSAAIAIFSAVECVADECGAGPGSFLPRQAPSHLAQLIQLSTPALFLSAHHPTARHTGDLFHWTGTQDAHQPLTCRRRLQATRENATQKCPYQDLPKSGRHGLPQFSEKTISIYRSSSS